MNGGAFVPKQCRPSESVILATGAAITDSLVLINSPNNPLPIQYIKAILFYGAVKSNFSPLCYDPSDSRRLHRGGDPGQRLWLRGERRGHLLAGGGRRGRDVPPQPGDGSFQRDTSAGLRDAAVLHSDSEGPGWRGAGQHSQSVLQRPGCERQPPYL